MASHSVTPQPPRRRLDATGTAGLAAVVLAGAWLAIGSASGSTIVDTGASPEPRWVAGPLHGLGPELSGDAFSVCLLAMLAGYLIALWRAARLDPRLLAAAIVVAHVAMALAPPLLSSDVFHYLAYPRLYALNGLNPYTHVPASVPSDPLLALIYWRHVTSPYGPLFTILTLPLAALGPTAAVWTLKAAIALISLAMVWAVAAAARRRGLSGRAAAAFVGLNPLLLVWAVGGAHNDVLVALALAGVLAADAAGTRACAGALGVMAAAVKASGAVALPYLIVARRRRGSALAGAAAAAALTVAVTLPVFGVHVLDVPAMLATGRRYVIDWSGPDVVGRLLGTGPSAGVRAACSGAALVAMLALLASLARRGGEGWVQAAGWATLAALLAVNSLEPWYLTVLLALAAASPSARLRAATVALMLWMVVVRLPVLGFDPLL
jgi:alpha-1,6-mannosyltransferase